MFAISCHRKFAWISIIIYDPLSIIHTLYRGFFGGGETNEKGLIKANLSKCENGVTCEKGGIA